MHGAGRVHQTEGVHATTSVGARKKATAGKRLASSLVSSQGGFGHSNCYDAHATPPNPASSASPKTISRTGQLGQRLLSEVVDGGHGDDHALIWVQ